MNDELVFFFIYQQHQFKLLGKFSLPNRFVYNRRRSTIDSFHHFTRQFTIKLLLHVCIYFIYLYILYLQCSVCMLCVFSVHHCLYITKCAVTGYPANCYGPRLDRVFFYLLTIITDYQRALCRSLI